MAWLVDPFIAAVVGFGVGQPCTAAFWVMLPHSFTADLVLLAGACRNFPATEKNQHRSLRKSPIVQSG